MRKLWNFIHHYLHAGPKITLEKIPAWVREDLEYGNKLVAMNNSILFFNISSRKTQTLYTDAYLYDFNGFYFEDSKT